MILFLSKLLPALLFPAGLASSLSFLACALALRARQFGLAAIVFAAGFLLYTASTPFVSERLARGLENQYPEPAHFPKATAIVLLGGAMLPDVPPRRHPEMNAAGDRVIEAARLWRQGLAPWMVVTGGSIPYVAAYRTSEATQYALMLAEMFGVSRDSILKVEESQNTAEDARYTSELFERRGLRKEILLVTSAMHLRRAVRLFRKHGFVVFPAPTDYQAPLPHPAKFFDFLPSEQSLGESADALHEYLGFAAYKMLGRI